MHRIDTPTAQKDKFGAGKNGFTRGNPQTGTPSTDLDDDYFDSLQEEIVGVIEAADIRLDKGDRGQLLKALKKHFQASDKTLTALAGLLTGANKLPYFTGEETAGQTDLTQVGRNIIGKATVDAVLEYLQLGEAAKRGVGTGANQIPDMAAFAMTMGQSGYQRLPSGKIEQWGVVALDGNGNAFATLPQSFTHGMHYGIATEAAPSGWAANSCIVAAVDIAQSSKTGVAIRARLIVGASGPSNATAGVSVRYYVLGQ